MKDNFIIDLGTAFAEVSSFVTYYLQYIPVSGELTETRHKVIILSEPLLLSFGNDPLMLLLLLSRRL